MVKATPADATVMPAAQTTAAVTPSANAGTVNSQRSFYRSRGDVAAMTMISLPGAAVDLTPEAPAAGIPATVPDGANDANEGVSPPLSESLWAWLAPHRVPRTDPAYTAFRPFIAVTRHILGAELVDLYGVLLTAFPVMTTYIGLLGPSLGPTIGGTIPAVDAGMLPYTPSLRRAAMASASAKSGCGYCTAHTVGVGGLLSGMYRGDRKEGGKAPTFSFSPPPCNDVGCGGDDRGDSGTAEAVVKAYAAAAAAWPPLLTPDLAAAAAAALNNNAAAYGALQSSVAYTGFLNTTMALLEPPLEQPLAPWVTAVVAASPDLAGHPVEAKAAAAVAAIESEAAQSAATAAAVPKFTAAKAAVAKAAAVNVTAVNTAAAKAVAARTAAVKAAVATVTIPNNALTPPAVGLLTAPPGLLPLAPPRGRLAKAVDLMRLLPAIARLPGATERLVLGSMPHDASGVTATVRSALGGHLPPVLVLGVLPTDELRRAVAAAYVDHFGPCASGEGGVFGGGGGGGGGGDGDDGRRRRHWSQEERVGLLARFAATAGNTALAAEAAALGAPLGGPAAAARAAARAAAAPSTADVAARIMDAAATRRAGGLGPDLAAVVSSGLPASAVVEAIGLAGFIGYLQRLWVVFLGAG